MVCALAFTQIIVVIHKAQLEFREFSHKLFQVSLLLDFISS